MKNNKSSKTADLTAAIQAGCTQYIIIAAGMDSYAYRCQSANNALNVEA